MKNVKLSGMQVRFAIVLFLSTPFTYGQEMAVPVDVHCPLLLNALTFDREFMRRVPDEIVLGILFQSTNRLSRKVKDDIESFVRREGQQIVQGHRVRTIPIDHSATADLSRSIASLGIHSLYVAPLPGSNIPEIAQVTRKENIVTLTGVPAYVQQGLSVGIWSEENRPAFVINAAASTAEGAMFDARILALARIVR